MADLPPDTGMGPNRGSTTGTPLWVKVFGIIGLALVLLVGIVMLAGGGAAGGRHGPGRHVPSGGAGGHTWPTSGHETTRSVGGPADAGGATRTIAVTALDTMAFAPVERSMSAIGTIALYALTRPD